jgi:hypothetical protein
MVISSKRSVYSFCPKGHAPIQQRRRKNGAESTYCIVCSRNALRISRGSHRGTRKPWGLCSKQRHVTVNPASRYKNGECKACKREYKPNPNRESYGAMLNRINKMIHIDKNGCHAWTGPTVRGNNSYPILHPGGRQSARRWIWKHLNGSVPEESRIYTTCGNTLCVNIEHMAIATAAQVGRIMGGITNKCKKRCKRGHLLSGHNLRISKKGFRCCKACAKMRYNDGRGENKRRPWMFCGNGHPLWNPAARRTVMGRGRPSKSCKACANERDRRYKRKRANEAVY